MMNRRPTLLFILLSILTLLLFLADLMWGSIYIAPSEVLNSLFGAGGVGNVDYIVLNFRLPKALTALVAGAGISIAGLQMQTLFRNPLADTSILGIGSGAGLGVALYMMTFALFPSWASGVSNTYSSWGIVTAAFVGALVVLLCISAIAAWLKDIISVLIIGVMVGFIASSLISILQFFADNETLRTYVIWSFGSVSGNTWQQLQLMIPIVSVGLILALLMPKYMNALNIGENYTRSVGIRVEYVRASLIIITSIITGTITAFTGPIAFLGIAVPHLCRQLFRTADHRILLPATIVCGSALLLLCDIISQVPGRGFVLPINAITSIIGAPVVIGVILRGKRTKSVFD